MDGPGVHKRIDSGLMDIVVQDKIIRILREHFALSVYRKRETQHHEEPPEPHVCSLPVVRHPKSCFSHIERLSFEGHEARQLLSVVPSYKQNR